MQLVILVGSPKKETCYSNELLLPSTDYDDVTHTRVLPAYRLWFGAQTADSDSDWLKTT